MKNIISSSYGLNCITAVFLQRWISVLNNPRGLIRHLTKKSKQIMHMCYIVRYTDVWNKHRESEIHDIHEIGSGTKLYYLWVKGYSIWGERHTIFLCWLLLHLPQTTCGTPSANNWSGLGGTWKSTFPFERRNSTNCFSQIPQILCASGYDVIHLPRFHFLSGNFYFGICEWHILAARALTPALMLHLTNPCTKRKVLLLTKPKGKIYKTRSPRNYITHG